MKQRLSRGKKWYAIKVASTYSESVKKAILDRRESLNLQDYIFDIFIPEVTEIEIRSGKQREVKKKLYPGYVFVQMIVTDESWYVVRNTPNVTGFIGVDNTPVPMSDSEIEIMREKVGQKQIGYSVNFDIGDMVIINIGPFSGHEGIIKELDIKKGSAVVIVNIFDRETPVEIDCTQITKAT